MYTKNGPDLLALTNVTTSSVYRSVSVAWTAGYSMTSSFRISGTTLRFRSPVLRVAASRSAGSLASLAYDISAGSHMSLILCPIHTGIVTYVLIDC